MTDRFSVLGPTEKQVLTYQFAAGLEGVETLIPDAVAVVTVDFGTDAAPNDIVDQVSISGTDVLVAISNQKVNVDYHIEITVPTSNPTKVLALAKILPVRNP